MGTRNAHDAQMHMLANTHTHKKIINSEEARGKNAQNRGVLELDLSWNPLNTHWTYYPKQVFKYDKLLFIFTLFYFFKFCFILFILFADMESAKQEDYGFADYLGRCKIMEIMACSSMDKVLWIKYQR